MAASGKVTVAAHSVAAIANAEVAASHAVTLIAHLVAIAACTQVVTAHTRDFEPVTRALEKGEAIFKNYPV